MLYKKDKKDNGNKKNYKIVIIASLITVWIVVGLILAQTDDVKGDISYKAFWEAVDKGEVESVTVYGNSLLMDVIVKDEDSGETRKVTSINPNYDDFLKDLGEAGVDIAFQLSDSKTATISSIHSVCGLLLTFVIIGYVFKSMSMFGSSSKKALGVDSNNIVMFDDIAGLTEEKEELKFAIDCLKNIDKLKELGVKPESGIIFEGPPGTGKTMLARAVAGEAGVPFFNYSGSDFVEMFVGRGAARIRDMYKKAKENAPCVVFIDEIDVLGKKRGGFNRHDEHDQTLTALLQRMDGLDSAEGILFIAATNRLDQLDSALTRPGRFGKLLHIGVPKNKKDREDIVRMYIKDKKIDDTVTVEKVAKLCFGFTGAQIKAVITNAVIDSVRLGRNGVLTMKNIDDAVMRLWTGGIAKGKHDEKVLYRVAVHEIGHAIMNLVVGREVIKVAIQPYSSGIGGVTVTDSDCLGESGIRSKNELIDDIMILYGGMIAEKVIFGDSSNGCVNDLEKATLILNEMINSYGMLDDSTISLTALSRENPTIVSNSKMLDIMNKFSHEIKDNVESYLSTSTIKTKIEELAKELMDKETIYNFNELARKICNDKNEICRMV